jgi:hypothetical protein
MENATSFEDAVTTLKTSDLIAPAYFVVAGVNPYEGVVLTRNQFEVIDVWILNASAPGFDKWFLLETNYDHWVPPPAKDDRRTPGIKAMNDVTQERIDFETLMSVITLKPVCNG